MKAIVMEIKNGNAAVLTDGGQFIKIKNCNYQVGMELTLEDEKKTPSQNKAKIQYIWTYGIGVAAALLLAFGIKDFYTPYSTISIDVNPSIEMSVNRYDLVLDITAVNDDAETIVNELNAEGLKYKSVEDVVQTALNQLDNGDYQAEDGTTYVVMSANSQHEEHSDELVEKLETISQTNTNITAKTIVADDDLMARAKDNGTTAGKLYLVDCLKEAEGEEDFDEDEWLKRPVKDIIQATNRIEGINEHGESVEQPSEQIELYKPEDTMKDNDEQPPEVTQQEFNTGSQNNQENLEYQNGDVPAKPNEDNSSFGGEQMGNQGQFNDGNNGPMMSGGNPPDKPN